MFSNILKKGIIKITDIQDGGEKLRIGHRDFCDIVHENQDITRMGGAE